VARAAGRGAGTVEPGESGVTVTITQVAREAGVSVATVSRALNDTGPVREEVRQRVCAVAERLRYVPHGGARSLITRKTGSIGVFLPDIHGEFFSEVIRGMDGVCRHRGYHLLVAGSHSSTDEILAVMRTTRGRVDGVIVMAPDLDAETIERDVPATLPLVAMNCRLLGSHFDSISIDNYGGAYAMVRHLTGVGHERIAFLTGPAHNYEASERLRGYRDALLACGGEVRDELEIAGDFTEESGQRGARAACALRPRPTAIFAANDGMALGVLAELAEAGLVVPRDIAVVGFDDIPVARYVSPPLSTVHVPIAELGARAMERLLLALERGSDHERRHEVLPTTLVVRGSCTPAAQTILQVRSQDAGNGKGSSSIRERRRAR
jgi:LacI family transcriptional regulator